MFPDSSVVKGIAEKPNSARKVVSFAGVDNGVSDVPPLCPIVANSVATSSANSGCFLVPEEWVERICEFAGFQPDLDAFASAKSRRFERYWDKHLDAFRHVWNPLKLWLNPPFSLLSKVVEKVVADSSRGILLVPWFRSGPRHPGGMTCNALL